MCEFFRDLFFFTFDACECDEDFFNLRLLLAVLFCDFFNSTRARGNRNDFYYNFDENVQWNIPNYSLFATSLNFFADIFFELIVECAKSEFFRDAALVFANAVRFSSRSLAFCNASVPFIIAFVEVFATFSCQSG